MNPVLVNVWRGEHIESRHRGAAIIVNAAGETLFSVGDVDSPVFPRSSVKLMQALPLIESGAADDYRLQDQHIALACASHNGEALHTGLVHDMLGRLDLNTDALVCGAQLPSHEETAHALIHAGKKPGREHHNCSGKHAGMLTICKHQGWDTADYGDSTHPAQLAWRNVISELCGVEADVLPSGIDGCGIPTLAFPLRQLAYGYASFTAATSGGSVRDRAMKRILDAITRYPMNIAGTDRACTSVIKASQGRVIVKTGAEGVFVGLIPTRGIAFALKVDDGATRGSEAALGGVLSWLDEPVAAQPELNRFFGGPIVNSQGLSVGRIEANPEVF